MQEYNKCVTLSKKNMEFTKEMQDWIKDGNVVKISRNRYLEQTTQWKKLFTKTELINFFIREFKN